MSVLRRQTSHPLLIHTNLGYDTILMAACARQGCSATVYYYCYYVVRLSGNIVNRSGFIRAGSWVCSRVRETYMKISSASDQVVFVLDRVKF
jgi:hypothetical protein